MDHHPHGSEPRVIIAHVETGERRTCFSVDAAEFVATGRWRRVETVYPEPGQLPEIPTGHGASPNAAPVPMKGAPVADRDAAAPLTGALAQTLVPDRPSHVRGVGH